MSDTFDEMIVVFVTYVVMNILVKKKKKNGNIFADFELLKFLKVVFLIVWI